ncbi:hypothetical protein C8F01DRAFT_1311044 [Mycena amicta]|nr:hypothetical protein C8F01DRAFT_1311044 [Mycena amicta]
MSTAPSPSFCGQPLTVAFDAAAENSRISLDWVLSSPVRARQAVVSGPLCLTAHQVLYSMQLTATVSSDLPHDLVLGRSWFLFCRETLPGAVFSLSSGVVAPSALAAPSTASSSTPSPMHVDHEAFSSPLPDHSDHNEPMNSEPMYPTHVPSQYPSSLPIIHDIFLKHRITGTPVLNTVVEGTDTEVSTESLLHIAAALNISISGKLHVRYKQCRSQTYLHRLKAIADLSFYQLLLSTI